MQNALNGFERDTHNQQRLTIRKRIHWSNVTRNKYNNHTNYYQYIAIEEVKLFGKKPFARINLRCCREDQLKLTCLNHMLAQ